MDTSNEWSVNVKEIQEMADDGEVGVFNKYRRTHKYIMAQGFRWICNGVRVGMKSTIVCACLSARDN